MPLDDVLLLRTHRDVDAVAIGGVAHQLTLQHLPRDKGPCDLLSKCSSASSTVSSGISSLRDSWMIKAATAASYSASDNHLVLVDNNTHVKSDPR